MRTWLCVATAIVVLSLAATVRGQASRTWVSGVGDDANPCSRTAPCKTFAGAISKTAAGGEIDVLDPGGFGAVTITKAITIDGTGPLSSILASGTNGIVINAGNNDNVTIRNLSINGNGTGLSAIRVFNAKSVRIEGVTIFGFTSRGVDVQTSTAIQVSLKNSVIRNCGNIGVVLGGSVPGVVKAALDHVSSEGNVAHGVWVTNGNDASISNSLFTLNGGAGVFVDKNMTTVEISNSTLTNNTTGVQSGQASFGGSFVRLSGNLISGNSVGVQIVGSIVDSHQNNAIRGNSIDVQGGAGLSPAGQQ